MHTKISKLLLIIVMILIVLLAYKTLKSLTVATTPATTTVEEMNIEIGNKEQIHGIIKEYLINNPEVIITAIERLQKRKTQEMEDKVKGYIKDKKSEIENVNVAPYIGNEQGKVTIVAFYDYNCSYCKKGDNNIRQLIESDKDVKVVYRPFPILGETSVYAAKIALAVNKLFPDKFRVVHEGLMEMKVITKEMVENLFSSQGIEYKMVEEEMSKPEIEEQLNKNFELAGNLRIQGAPAYIINDKVIPGLIDLKQLQQIILELKPTP